MAHCRYFHNLMILPVIPLALFFMDGKYLHAKEVKESLQPREMITDRPDITESSNVVPKGFVQLEAGYLFTTDKMNDIRTSSHQVPNALFRIGVHDQAELRIVVNGVSLRTVGGALQRGAVDAQVGTKIHFWEERGWLPETSLIAMLTLPVGDREFSSERLDPSALLSVSYTLSEKLSVGSNFGPAWVTDESDGRDTLGQFNWTLSFGYEFFEGFGMFYEIFGNQSLSDKGKDAQSFDAGLTYLATPNIQLDASAGVGLNSAADDFFAGAGITVRFPQ